MMQVSTSTFTIAEYCEQLERGTIAVNTDYQRSSEVWPPAARSYLIDTILLSFPIPKLTLYQTVDLKTKKTLKEIVDGQQRTSTINAFYNDEFRITGKSEYRGLRFSDLEEEDQQRFVEYRLTTDTLLSATPDDVRQLFRRINSYTVPLNKEEQRHAQHQGEFKWFMVELTEKYASSLKEMGVLKEKQLSRMQDAKLFTEIVLGVLEGMETYAVRRLDKIYTDNDDHFEYAKDLDRRFDKIFDHLLEWSDLHNGPLMKFECFLSLALAITHVLAPVATLQPYYKVSVRGLASQDWVLSKLSSLAEALDDEGKATKPSHHQFREAMVGTNTKVNRTKRFNILCRAIAKKQPTG